MARSTALQANSPYGLGKARTEALDAKESSENLVVSAVDHVSHPRSAPKAGD